ncbi:hypothetical protein [Aquimarina sediminis]|uniref:hypothetical protein n=1 Tax=Aquimarina sediminis TaxID=2070536 RepID=UPI000CA08E18|nr:hypothetical protein [Aquimarina sediminis]
MKTQNFKKLVLLSVGILFFSCSTSDLTEADETLSLEKTNVEIVENPESKLVISAGYLPGIYGSSNVNAYQNATYSYFLSQAELNAVPSHLRRFKVRFQVRNSNGNWVHKQSYLNQPSTVTAKFPKYGNNNTATWRIGFQMYNKNTNTYYSKSWKKVTVNN